MAESRSVLITGASRGIGRACALGLGRRGWHVFAGVRDERDGQALQDAGVAGITPVLLDVTSETCIQAVAGQIAAVVGGRGLDALVNNAGIAIAGPLEFVTRDDFRAQLETNVLGPLSVTQAMLDMLRAARGRVVMVSSVSGRVGLPFIGPYSASKSALEAMSDALRLELRSHGVSVSVIQPGPIDTAMVEDSIQDAEQRLEGVSPQVLALYGPMIRAALATSRGTSSNSLPTEAVVQDLLHALESRRPRTRYLTIRMGWTVRLATSLLPDRWRDAAILRILSHYEARRARSEAHRIDTSELPH